MSTAFIERVPLEHYLERGITVTESGCWLWRTLNKRGYGVGNRQGKKVTMHIYTYELHVGEVPAGLVLDHLCETLACCNPYHVEPVTQRVNLERAGVSGASSCRRGHPRNPENTSYRTVRCPTGAQNEMRIATCRICTRESQQRRRQRTA